MTNGVSVVDGVTWTLGKDGWWMPDDMSHYGGIFGDAMNTPMWYYDSELWEAWTGSPLD